MTGGEVVIDLGAAEPWTPPDEPPAARRWRARWLLPVLLAVLAATLPGAVAPAAGALLHLGIGAQSVAMGGGRAFVTVYSGEGAHHLQAYDTGTGRRLWDAELQDGAYVAFAGADVVMLSSERAGQPLLFSAVLALDPRTGAQLWRRPAADVVGQGAGLVVLRDLTNSRVPDADEVAKAESGEGPPLQLENRILAADPRTGAVAWELLVPPGSQAAFGWDPASSYTMRSLSVLDPDGALRLYDQRTGAVARAARLAWSGPVGWFELGEGGEPGPPGARAGQVAVTGHGAVGTDVFDLATGRALWHVDTEPYSVLRGCAPGWWCGGGNHGMIAYAAATGEPVWRGDAFDAVFGYDDGVLVLGRLTADGQPLTGLHSVDVRTGAPLGRLDGWWPSFGLGQRMLVFWRTEAQSTTLVGQLDARTGRVTVLGRTDLWAAGPQCVADERSVACGVNGDLVLWRAPPA